VNIIFKNFINLNNEEKINILDIRNTDKIRINMKSNHIISTNIHINWIEKLKEDKNNIYYAIIYKDKICGAIYINDINLEDKTSSWGLYFKQDINPILSSLCTYIIIDKILNEMNIQRLTLEVEKTNIQAYKFDLSFGFEIYDTINNYFLMDITKQKWEKNKNIAYIKLLEKKVNKIQYKFV